MNFPVKCVQTLIDFVRGKTDATTAALCLSGLLAYFFFKVAEHDEPTVIGSELEPKIIELSNELGHPIPMQGPLVDYFIRIMLPIVLERLADSAMVQEAVDFLAEELRKLLEKM